MRTVDQPLSLEQYQVFLLDRTYASPSMRLRGKPGLLKVLQRLQGFATYPRLWKRDVLPLRVHDFDPDWLHELIHEGRLLFGRFGMLGESKTGSAPGGGTILCERGTLCDLLIKRQWPELTGVRHSPPLHGMRLLSHRVYEVLSHSDCQSLGELTHTTGLSRAKVRLGLWSLYNIGAITNTVAESLLDSDCTVSFPMGADTEANADRQRAHGLRAEVGRWVTCMSLLPDWGSEADEAELLARRVHRALMVLGVAPLSVLEAHLGGLFAQRSGRVEKAALRQACQALAARKQAVKGVFVADLGAEQYALPQTVEQLRAAPETKRQLPVMISSLDPAALHIAVIPVPSVTPYCAPGRFFVLHQGRLMAIIDCKAAASDRFVADNLTLFGRYADEDASGLIDAMAEYARRAGDLEALEVRKVRGSPIAEQPLRSILLCRGFEAAGSGLRVRLDCLQPWDRRSRRRVVAVAPPAGSSDRLEMLRAVLEKAAGTPLKRQRSGGGWTLRLNGRLVADMRDGQDPRLICRSVTRDQSPLYHKIPKQLLRLALARADKHDWGRAWSVEVRLPEQADLRSRPLLSLVSLWVRHTRNHLQETRQKRAQSLAAKRSKAKG